MVTVAVVGVVCVTVRVPPYSGVWVVGDSMMRRVRYGGGVGVGGGVGCAGGW